MARNQEIDRYKKCWRCQETNSTHIATSDTDGDPSVLTFSYWCKSCEHHFAYRVRIDVVHDKEGRI